MSKAKKARVKPMFSLNRLAEKEAARPKEPPIPLVDVTAYASRNEKYGTELRDGLDFGSTDERVAFKAYDELNRRAWTIANRDFSDAQFGDRVMEATDLAFAALTQAKEDPAVDPQEILDLTYRSIRTWLYEHRAELLTLSEAEEIEKYVRRRRRTASEEV